MRTALALKFVSILLAIGACAGLAAETVYTWTDTQGVRHFSQYPPEDSDVRADTIILESTPAVSPATDRLQNMRDVARDLETSRVQREEARAQSNVAPSEPGPPPAQRTETPIWTMPYPGLGPLPGYPGAYPYYPPRRYPPGYDRPDSHPDRNRPHPPHRPHRPDRDRPDDAPGRTDQPQPPMRVQP